MRWYRQRSRRTIEYPVMFDRPPGLLPRLRGLFHVPEYGVVRVDSVVEDQLLGCHTQRLFHGELMLLCVSGQQLVLGLIQFCLSHFQRPSNMYHVTASIKIQPNKTPGEFTDKSRVHKRAVG